MKKTEENDYLKEFKNIDKLPKEFTFFDIDNYEANININKLDQTFIKLLKRTMEIPFNLQNFIKGD